MDTDKDKGSYQPRKKEINVAKDENELKHKKNIWHDIQDFEMKEEYEKNEDNILRGENIYNFLKNDFLILYAYISNDKKESKNEINYLYTKNNIVYISSSKRIDINDANFINYHNYLLRDNIIYQALYNDINETFHRDGLYIPENYTEYNFTLSVYIIWLFLLTGVLKFQKNDEIFLFYRKTIGMYNDSLERDDILDDVITSIYSSIDENKNIDKKNKTYMYIYLLFGTIDIFMLLFNFDVSLKEFVDFIKDVRNNYNSNLNDFNLEPSQDISENERKYWTEMFYNITESVLFLQLRLIYGEYNKLFELLRMKKYYLDIIIDYSNYVSELIENSTHLQTNIISLQKHHTNLITPAEYDRLSREKIQIEKSYALAKQTVNIFKKLFNTNNKLKVLGDQFINITDQTDNNYWYDFIYWYEDIDAYSIIFKSSNDIHVQYEIQVPNVIVRDFYDEMVHTDTIQYKLINFIKNLKVLVPFVSVSTIHTKVEIHKTIDPTFFENNLCFVSLGQIWYIQKSTNQLTEADMLSDYETVFSFNGMLLKLDKIFHLYFLMNEGGWGGSREVDMNSVLSIEDKIIHYNTEEQQSAWG